MYDDSHLFEYSQYPIVVGDSDGARKNVRSGSNASLDLLRYGHLGGNLKCHRLSFAGIEYTNPLQITKKTAGAGGTGSNLTDLKHEMARRFRGIGTQITAYPAGSLGK